MRAQNFVFEPSLDLGKWCLAQETAWRRSRSAHGVSCLCIVCLLSTGLRVDGAQLQIAALLLSLGCCDTCVCFRLKIGQYPFVRSFGNSGR